MPESGFCLCGLPCDSDSHVVHLFRQKNRYLHQFTKQQPHADARDLMFTIWAVEKAVTSDAAEILIHAGLHVHLSNVLNGEEKMLEGLEMIGEYGAYATRASLELVFPYIRKIHKPDLTDQKLFDLLFADPLFEVVHENEMREIIVEWRRRYAV